VHDSIDSKLRRAAAGIELPLALSLIGLDVAARVLLHAPNLSPVAASALFAGVIFRSKALALAVPLAAMALSDLVLGSYDWRIMAVGYAALALPALLGMWARWSGRRLVVVALVPAMSLIFFIASNFAVWAFSGMYPLTAQGLIACYIAALPFLQYTLLGDVLWSAALFGGWWAASSLVSRFRSSPQPAARSDANFGIEGH
jgi:hypothetical protein